MKAELAEKTAELEATRKQADIQIKEASIAVNALTREVEE
jgi:hypothetical protein